MTSQRSINQHYVPQSYLKRFADAEDRVFAFDKATGRRFHPNVRNVASEHRFYDLPAEIEVQAGGPQTMEGIFQLVDYQIHQCLERIWEAERIETLVKPDLAVGIVMQLLRTPQARQLLIAEMQAEFPDEFAVFEGDKRLLHAVGLTDKLTVEKLWMKLPERLWLLGINESPWPFWTSDHPVVRVVRDQSGGTPIGDTGYSWGGEHIAWPLAPEVMLLIYELECVEAVPDVPQFDSLDDLDGTAIRIPDDDVARYNRLEFDQSKRLIFSVIDNFGVYSGLTRALWTD